MNLIFLYGPPASGKLTCSNELAGLTGYKVYDNHVLLNGLVRLFPFEDKVLSDHRKGLARRIRLDIFKTAAAANVSCITTFGQAGPDHFDFFSDVRRVVESGGGSVYFVQLKPRADVLLQRVEEESRKSQKIDSRVVLEAKLKNEPTIFEKFPEVEHLTIDNSDLTPQEVAQQICEYYHL